MRGERARLEDMLAAIAAIRRHTTGGRAAYDRDELVRVWVIHHLQVIGEAAARLDPAGEAARSLPQTGIVGMRNVLVHGYFQIDDDLVWTVVERVEGGEVLTLTRHGKPGARLVPVAERRPGLLKGRIGMASDFDATPEWLVDAFEGGGADGPLQP